MDMSARLQAKEIYNTKEPVDWLGPSTRLRDYRGNANANYLNTI